MRRRSGRRSGKWLACAYSPCQTHSHVNPHSGTRTTTEAAIVLFTPVATWAVCHMLPPFGLPYGVGCTVDVPVDVLPNIKPQMHHIMSLHLIMEGHE